jgi:hypothetical protein
MTNITLCHEFLHLTICPIYCYDVIDTGNDNISEKLEFHQKRRCKERVARKSRPLIFKSQV